MVKKRGEFNLNTILILLLIFSLFIIFNRSLNSENLGLNEAEKAACQVAEEINECYQTGTLPFTPPLTAERCCTNGGWCCTT